MAAETGTPPGSSSRWVRLQWGRGSVAAETEYLCSSIRTLRVASMGPRLGGRGDQVLLTVRPPLCSRFNGAAARWPRRRSSRTSPQGIPPRFNGAAARWPRRLNAIRALQDLLPSGFNGAAARWPRRPGGPRRARVAHAASMGPRLGGRGDSSEPQARHHGRPASMGPRLGGRGDKKPDGWKPGQRVASMGPRLGGRGDNGARGTGNLCLSWLQWGRGSVAAETGIGVQIRLWRSTASMGPRLGGRGDGSRRLVTISNSCEGHCEWCFRICISWATGPANLMEERFHLFVNLALFLTASDGRPSCITAPLAFMIDYSVAKDHTTIHLKTTPRLCCVQGRNRGGRWPQCIFSPCRQPGRC